MFGSRVSDNSYTKICIFYDVGCTKDNCKFAHNAEQIRPPMCGFGNDCSSKTCDRYHSWDKIPYGQELFDLQRRYQEQVDGVVFPTKKVFKPTKVCTFYKAGCKKDGCTFAHTPEQLHPSMCRFRDDCTNGECNHWHPSDNIPTGQALFDYQVCAQEDAGIKFPNKTKSELVDLTIPTFERCSSSASTLLLIDIDDDELSDDESVEFTDSVQSPESVEPPESPESPEINVSNESTVIPSFLVEDESPLQAEEPKRAMSGNEEEIKKFEAILFDEEVEVESSTQSQSLASTPTSTTPTGVRFQFEATMTLGEMSEILNLLHSRGFQPIITNVSM